MSGMKTRELLQQACGFHESGLLEKAEARYREVLLLDADAVMAHMNIGLILKQTGRLDEAAMHFSTVTRLKPDLAQAHFQLAHLRTHISSEEEIEAMRRLFDSPGIEDKDRIPLAFGLSAALEKNGRYPESFDVLQEGRRLMKSKAPFDIEAHRRHFDGLMQLFSREYFERQGDAGAPGKLPIFIVGMPRSGTTLTEQILASHPAVDGGGELSYLEGIVREVGSDAGKPFVYGWRDLKRKDIRGLGVSYLRNLSRHSRRGKHVTDTTPMNFRLVGLIAAMLPGAKIIHCTRDPMDTCLSIFQQPLADTHAYANDLADLGEFYRMYVRMMAYWHQVLPGRIHDLRYEDLIQDPEAEVGRLLDYCDLPFAKECLEFHKTNRKVNTPSASQVRQPLYKGSLGRWRRYEEQLAPLRAVLSRPY